MERLLGNVKVLDFTRVLAGPFATMILGDLGAKVIKVEPLNGDEARTWPPKLKNGESGYYWILNRNKKSITLNLKDPRGKEIAQNLSKKVDVVIENFAPGVAEKLGIDYSTLSKDHPELIYCSISGFGQYGPYRDRKAYDPIIQGMTGLMSITGERNRGPVKVGIPISDLVSAIYAVVAIEAAYIDREKTGKGHYIDVALYDSMISLLTIMAMEYLTTGRPPERWGLDHIHRVPACAFETKDGKYVQVAATNEVMYPKFCQVAGLEELAGDPRFDTNTNRLKNRDIIMPIIAQRMRQKTRDEWLALFEKADLPCGPILDLDEVFADPQVEAREMLFYMDHPVEGQVAQLGFPYKFSDTPLNPQLRPPGLGEHNQEILREWLDYTAAQVEKLRADKVI